MRKHWELMVENQKYKEIIKRQMIMLEIHNKRFQLIYHKLKEMKEKYVDILEKYIAK